MFQYQHNTLFDWTCKCLGKTFHRFLRNRFYFCSLWPVTLKEWHSVVIQTHIYWNHLASQWVKFAHSIKRSGTVIGMIVHAKISISIREDHTMHMYLLLSSFTNYLRMSILYVMYMLYCLNQFCWSFSRYCFVIISCRVLNICITINLGIFWVKLFFFSKGSLTQFKMRRIHRKNVYFKIFLT